MLNELICEWLTNCDKKANITTDFNFAGLKAKTIALRLSKPANQLVIQFAKESKLRPSDAGYCILASILSCNAEEAWYQLTLSAKLNGKREVPVPCGRIDIVTDSLIIEVKTVKQYKHAIGQVLCYSLYKPNRRPAIALFGKTNSKERKVIQSCCHSLAIELIWLEA